MDVQRINGLATELGRINASIELNENNIQACVKASDFEQDKEILNGNMELLKQQQLDLVATSESLSINIRSLVENGMNRLKNTMFEITDEGMKIANDQDEFNALYNNKGSYLFSYNKLVAKYHKDGGESPVFSVTEEFNMLGIKFEKEIENNEQVIMGHWQGW